MKNLIITIAFLIGIGYSSSLASSNAAKFGITFGFFYTSLNPYGEWIEFDNGLYGWRPIHVSYGWRPYYMGRWVWTRYGWYWDSYEPFGWATYHYGRWYFDNYYGWIWIPDYEWAPAWVEWRYNDDYIGWAPLPPYAVFSVNIGIYFSINWVSPYYYWNFVPHKHFCHHNLHQYIENSRYRYRIYENTRYRNEYGYENGRVINRGVERDYIERRSGERIREFEITETTRLRDYSGNRSLEKNRVEIYRPTDDDIARSRVREFDIKKADRRTTLETSKVELKRDFNIPDRKRDVSNSERNIIIDQNRSREMDRQIERSRDVNRDDELRKWQNTERKSETRTFERKERSTWEQVPQRDQTPKLERRNYEPEKKETSRIFESPRQSESPRIERQRVERQSTERNYKIEQPRIEQNRSREIQRDEGKQENNSRSNDRTERRR